MVEQNLEILATLTPTPDVNTFMLYTGAMPKRKIVTALLVQQQPGDETIPMRCPNQVP